MRQLRNIAYFALALQTCNASRTKHGSLTLSEKDHTIKLIERQLDEARRIISVQNSQKVESDSQLAEKDRTIKLLHGKFKKVLAEYEQNRKDLNETLKAKEEEITKLKKQVTPLEEKKEEQKEQQDPKQGYVKLMDDIRIRYANAKQKGKHQQCLNHAQHLLELSLLVYDAPNEITAFAYNSIGAAHGNLGDYNKAKVNYETAEKIYKSMNSTTKESIYPLFNLGLVYEKTGQLGKAKDYYKKALDIQNARFGAKDEKTIQYMNALNRARTRKGTSFASVILSGLGYFFEEARETKK